MSKILEALGKLDPTNDAHWTSDGLPRVDTVRLLAANPALDRDQITAAAPGFSRQTPGLQAATAPASAPAPVVTPPVAPVAADAAAQPVGDAGASAGDNASLNADLENESTDPADVLAHLQVRKSEVEAELAEFDAQMAKANEYRQSLVARHDDIVNELANLNPQGATNAIQAYQESQKRQAQQRAETLQSLRDGGVNLSTLRSLTKAPAIEASRSRRQLPDAN